MLTLVRSLHWHNRVTMGHVRSFVSTALSFENTFKNWLGINLGAAGSIQQNFPRNGFGCPPQQPAERKDGKTLGEFNTGRLCSSVSPLYKGTSPVWSSGLSSRTQSPPGRMNLRVVHLLWRTEHLPVTYLGDYFLVSFCKYLGCSAQENGLPREIR